MRIAFVVATVMLVVLALAFTLPPGGIVGIIGPNGAGKTTYFNLISGQLTATRGTVWRNWEGPLAFADRAEFLGDTDFADVPVARLLSRIITDLASIPILYSAVGRFSGQFWQSLPVMAAVLTAIRHSRPNGSSGRRIRCGSQWALITI